MQHRLPGPAAIALAGMLSLAVAMGIGRFAFTPMLPLMIGEGQLDLAAGGWVAAANYAGYLVGAMTAARTGWGAVKLGVVALVATVVLTAAMALPMHPAIGAALRFAAGVASAWVFVATAIWSLGALAVAGRSGWSSGVYAGVGLGIAVAGLLVLAGGALGAPAAALWCALALLALVLLVPVGAVMRQLQPAQGATRAAAGPRELPPGTRGLVVCYAAFGFGYILPATFLPVLARGVVQDPRLFGLAWPVFGATAAVSTLLAGWALRRASRLQVWSVSHLAMGVGVLLPSVWPTASSIALSAVLVGGTFMIVTMVGVQEIRARAGSADATALVARMTAAFAFGQIAGPIASSLLLHVPGFAHNGLQLALQLAAAILLLTAAWLWHMTRQPLQEMLHAR